MSWDRFSLNSLGYNYSFCSILLSYILLPEYFLMMWSLKLRCGLLMHIPNLFNHKHLLPQNSSLNTIQAKEGGHLHGWKLTVPTISALSCKASGFAPLPTNHFLMFITACFCGVHDFPPSPPDQDSHPYYVFLLNSNKTVFEHFFLKWEKKCSIGRWAEGR